MHPVIKLWINLQLSRSLLLIAVSVITAALNPLSYSLAQEKEINWSLPSLAGTKQLRIKGYQPRLMLRFSLPAQWEGSGNGQLRLDYRISQLVLPNKSNYVKPTTTLSTFLNGQPLIAIVPTPGRGTTTIELPSKYLRPGENQLRLKALLPVRGDARCVKPDNPDRWIEFSPTSHLRMNLVPRSQIPPLWEFPNQFIPFVPDTDTSSVITFVVPKQADNNELSALAALAYALASEAPSPVKWRLETVETFRLDQATGPTILVGTVASNPHLIHLTPPGGRGYGWLAITRLEENYPLLAVGGPNSKAVLEAARMLADPELRLGLVGLTALATHGTKAPETNLSETFNLADLGYAERTAYGTGEKSLTYNFHLPFWWSLQSGDLQLHYSHSRYLYEETSSLKVILNRTPLATMPLTGPEGGAHVVDVSLPKKVLQPGRNDLKFTFDFSTPADHCGAATPEGFSGSIGEATSLTLPHGERGNLIELKRFPYMLTNEGDVARTAIVLPDRPTVKDVVDALQVIRLLSVSGSRFPPRLWRAEALEPNFAQFHLIVLGEWSGQSLLSELNPYLYLPFDPKQGRFNFTLGIKSPFQKNPPSLVQMMRSLWKVPSPEVPARERGIGVAQAVRSPYKSRRVIVAITGATYKGYRAALRTVLEPSLRSQVDGQLAVAVKNATGEVEVTSQNVADIGTVPALAALNRAVAPLTGVRQIWALLLLPLLSLALFAALFCAGRAWSQRLSSHKGGH